MTTIDKPASKNNTMKNISVLSILLAFLLVSCSGADTVVKKKWESRENTISVVDLSPQDDGFVDAGTHVVASLEESLMDTIFVLKNDRPRYQLKFKVTKYREGNRWARLATFGLSESARGELQVKAALYDGKTMVGAWEVNTWVKGGSSKDSLFKKAALEIIDHLKDH